MTAPKPKNVYRNQSLRVLSWNIQSAKNNAGSKLDYADFSKLIHENDIVCLQETRQIVETTGFRTFSNLRRAQKSGGVVTLVNNSIKSGVEKVTTSLNKSTEILVIKLHKTFFNTKQDTFLINTYIRPSYSNTTNTTINGLDTFTDLDNIINELSKEGSVILCGDFNARIHTTPDFIPDESPNTYIGLPTDYTPDNHTYRNCYDLRTNAYKRPFLDLILNNQLVILNGRTLGDFQGKFTCIEHNGASVVDYFIISPTLKTNIKHLTIGELTEFSDHTPLHLHLYLAHNKAPILDKKKIFKMAPPKFRFTPDNTENYKAAQLDTEHMDTLKTINEKTYTSDNEGSTSFNNDFTELINRIAESSVEKIQQKPPPKLKHKPWFSLKCRNAKKEVKKSLRILSSHPKSDYLRLRYYKIKKAYSKLIKRSKEKYMFLMNKKIEDGRVLNWKQLKALKNSSDRKTEFDAHDIQNFESFFKGLYSDTHTTLTTPTKSNLIHQADSVNSNPRTPPDSELNSEFTTSEIISAIKSLKNQKSSSSDLINNEMLKNLNDNFVDTILKLFNHCFDTGTYPWHESIITPILKKGDFSNPDNYRAIAVGSCLGKLYSSILLDRFIKYRNTHSPDPINQLGFTKHAQTSDHLLVIHTIASKYKKLKEKVYTVFVDFKKAFDSVARQALFFKLAHSGITGKFYNTIRHMYSKSTARIKLSGYVSNPIELNKGTEQGHPLSPDLFKLFLSDLSPLLEASNCPVLDDISVGHLLWADDLVIFALDPATLQKQLNALSDFCNKWGLDINTDKTKHLVFNETKSNNSDDKFRIGGQILDKVDSYCYLGLDLHKNGSFKLAVSNLKAKALRSFYALIRQVNRTAISFQSGCTLFDALIKPIMLYAAPIWTPSLAISKTLGAPRTWLDNLNYANLARKISNEPSENLHLKFLKWILGVHSKASNIAAWGETGRKPLIYESLRLTLNYLVRIKSINPDRLVSRALKDQIRFNLPWYKNLDQLITTHTQPSDSLHTTADVCTSSRDNANQTTPTPLPRPLPTNNNTTTHHDPTHNPTTPKPKLTKIIIKSLTSDFEKLWNSVKSSSTKLSFYHKMKQSFSREEYLDLVKKFKARSCLTKLRISAHELEIEKGRYCNTARDERTCKWCKLTLGIDAIEDEEHFLAKCDLNSQLRENFLSRIQSGDGQADYDRTALIKYLLPDSVTTNKPHWPTLGRLLVNMFNNRNEFLLSENDEPQPIRVALVRNYCFTDKIPR